MKRCADKLDNRSRILFYKSIISPHLDYCSTILFLLPDSQLGELQKIQNRCMRLILRVGPRTHIKDMLETLNWLSVRQKITLNTLKFIHRMAIGDLPAALSDRIVPRSASLTHNLRSKDLVQLARARTDFAQNSLFYKGVQLYNNFKTVTTLNLNRCSRSLVDHEMKSYVTENLN